MLRGDSKIKIRGKNGKLVSHAGEAAAGSERPLRGSYRVFTTGTIHKFGENKIKLNTHKPKQMDSALDRFLKSRKF